MALDPKAAAAAAQAAAEAAKAAAAEAAREAAIAAAKAAAAAQAQATATGGAIDPAIGAPEQGAHADADLTGLAEPHVEGSVLEDATSRAGSLEGGRSALLDLPGLEVATAADIGGGSLGDLPLGSVAPTGGDIGKDAIGDGMGWVGIKNTVEGLFIDYPAWELKQAAKAVGEWLAPSFDGPAPGPTTDGEVDGGTVDPDETSGGTEGASDPDLDAGQPDEDEDDDPESAGTSGGSTDVSRPAPGDGGYTGDWSGITPIGPGSGDDDLVSGATGNTGTSGGSGPTGPQGGDWAINPGSEGFVAGRETDLRDAEAWYGGVGQPGDPTLDVVAGNPALLEQGIQAVDPNTVNPSGGEGTSSDSETQASTAYRAMPAMAGDGGTGTSAETDGPAGTSQASLGGETELTETMPVQDQGGLTGATAESDADRAMPFAADSTVDSDANFEPDREDRGREWGQSHGQGHGRGGRGGAGDDRDDSTAGDDLGDSPG